MNKIHGHYKNIPMGQNRQFYASNKIAKYSTNKNKNKIIYGSINKMHQLNFYYSP